jgi:hypothetical protein
LNSLSKEVGKTDETGGLKALQVVDTHTEVIEHCLAVTVFSVEEENRDLKSRGGIDEMGTSMTNGADV